jgi:hypothetical protein
MDICACFVYLEELFVGMMFLQLIDRRWGVAWQDNESHAALCSDYGSQLYTIVVECVVTLSVCMGS